MIGTVRGDITTRKVNAIVSATSEGAWTGGNACGAIHAAAGPEPAGAGREIGRGATGDGIRSPAIPSVGAGIFRFPMEEATMIAMRVLRANSRDDLAVRLFGFDTRTMAARERTCPETFAHTRVNFNRSLQS